MVQHQMLEPDDVKIRGRIVCNRRMRLITSDWDMKARDSISKGKGFRITEDGKTDSKSEPGKFSIHSPLYGTDIHNEHAFEDRYSCECGDYMGRNFEGKICPHCKTKVEFIDIDMSTTGWIILDKDVVINTIYFKKIKSFIGGKIFPDIIKFKEFVDRVETTNNPFDGIGCIEFQERFQEIMDFYLKKNSSNPKKRDMYFFIISHYDQVFAHAIPVYSSHLRPFVVRADEIKYTDDDKLFRRIYTNAKMLNDKYELERKLDIARNSRSKNRTKTMQYLRRENIIHSIQTDLDKLWDMSFDNIKKKQGIIRDKILGGRLNFSARNVICPGKNLKANEIELGYITFLELYKLEIISILTNIHDIPHSTAWSMFEEASINFNEQIYRIMLFMLKHYDIICEINRNPTINYGSELCMRVVHVNSDMTDHCMILPTCILTLLNADYDGDVLNINSLKIDDIKKEYYEQLNPMNNIFISRNDGKYNMDASLLKDQAIGLYCFANI